MVPVLKMTALKILEVSTSQSPVMIMMLVQLIFVDYDYAISENCDFIPLYQ